MAELDSGLTVEEAAEAELRRWATDKKLTGKAVNMLIKDGFSSMEAVVLLDKEDLLQSKIPRGQQKLLLKALLSLRPRETTTASASDAAGTTERDRSSTIEHVATRGAQLDAGTTDTDTRQSTEADTRPDLYARMATEHMRAMQASQPTARTTSHTSDLGPLVNDVTSLGRGAHYPNSWQDPQIHLAAASGQLCDGKPPSYHDITDFVSRDRVEEQVIAGNHDGTQVIIKTGGKVKLEGLTLSQWSIANLAILYRLQQQGDFTSQSVIDYLSHTTKIYQLIQRYDNVSVFLYDREYRQLQACHGFRFGTDIPHLHTVHLHPRGQRNVYGGKSRSNQTSGGGQKSGKPGPVTSEGRQICKLFNTQRGCSFTDCKFVHACSYRGYDQLHPAVNHFPPR